MYAHMSLYFSIREEGLVLGKWCIVRIGERYHVYARAVHEALHCVVSVVLEYEALTITRTQEAPKLSLGREKWMHVGPSNPHSGCWACIC